MKPPHHARRTLSFFAVLACLVGVSGACNSTKGSDAQTNWLSPCTDESDCGAGLACFCGTCTTTCATACGTLGTGAQCLTPAVLSAGSCAPILPKGGVCSLSCTRDADCAAHASTLRCVGGACLATPGPGTDAGASGSGGASGGGGASSSGGAQGTDTGDAGLGRSTAPLLISIANFTNAADPGATVPLSNGIVRGFLPPRCQRKEFGTCLVDNCLVRRDGNLYGLTGISAGKVTIQGGTGADVTLEPDAFGVYPLFTPTAARWHAGDTLQITAAGGADVSAFSATLSFLTPVVLTTPTVSPITVVDRTKGMNVTWTPTDETVSVGALLLGPGGDTWDQIQGTCDFPGTAGSATLPAEFFADFPAGSLQVYAGHSQVKTQTAGSHPVRLLTLDGINGISATLP